MICIGRGIKPEEWDCPENGIVNTIPSVGHDVQEVRGESGA